jgi:hypothetical protein
LALSIGKTANLSRASKACGSRKNWMTPIRSSRNSASTSPLSVRRRSTEVLTLRGLATYYVLFFIHLESRRVDIAGITVQLDEPWMKQIARNVTMEGCGALRDCRYLLHDRDTKYTQAFRAIIASGRVEPLALPAQSPPRRCGTGARIQ